MSRRWPRASDLQAESIERLVAIYEEAAAASEKLTPSASQNAAADCVARVYDELRRRGPDAQRALLPFIAHARPGVRGWAAAHALEFETKVAEQRLKQIAATDPFPHGFNAKMVLQEWRAGRLRFPTYPRDDG
jgi:hypothetical protein